MTYPLGSHCIIRGQSWAGVWCIISRHDNGTVTAEDEYGSRRTFKSQELELC